jgi:hypothetical protein
MGINQVEKLYKKMISFDDFEGGIGKIDIGVRTEIFQRIMDEIERLLKKMKSCNCDSEEYRDIDCKIRRLLLKEIQVIIDDYIISQKNGTLERWKNMYGDLNHYIRNFYMYRDEGDSQKLDNNSNNYGFYDQEDMS